MTLCEGEHEDVGINVGINEEKILEILRKTPKVTAKELAGQTDMTSRQIERILSKLKKDGRLTRVGAKKNGYWKVTG